jgi:hypothetical protein
MVSDLWFSRWLLYRVPSRGTRSSATTRCHIPEHGTPYFNISLPSTCRQPITVAHSNAGVVVSNPTQATDVCARLFCVHAVVCVGTALARGWSPVQGVLPTVYMITKLKESGQGPTKGRRATFSFFDQYSVILLYACYMFHSSDRPTHWRTRLV